LQHAECSDGIPGVLNPAQYAQHVLDVRRLQELSGHHISQMGYCGARCARLVISAAARRVKVSSRIRSGRVLVTIRCATRCASVLVFPVPAPAMIRSGPEISAPETSETPYSTADR
jgi:hypothetical protein